MDKPEKGKYSKFSDEHLMMSVHHGDVFAFNELYNRYSKRLLYYFYRMLGSSQEKSRDFLQDIFIKVIERPELFDTKRKFSTWIFSVAHNMCKNEYRRMAVRSNTVNEANAGQYSEVDEVYLLDRQLTADQIFKEIDHLEETEKSAFILYYREDFSIQEIGKILDLPEGTVKSKLFYARKKLANKLQIQGFK